MLRGPDAISNPTATNRTPAAHRRQFEVRDEYGDDEGDPEISLAEEVPLSDVRTHHVHHGCDDADEDALVTATTSRASDTALD